MPKPKTEAATYKMITLRVPEDLLALLKRQQKAMGRTFNGHALHVLRYGLGVETRAPMPKDYDATPRQHSTGEDPESRARPLLSVFD